MNSESGSLVHGAGRDADSSFSSGGVHMTNDGICLSSYEFSAQTRSIYDVSTPRQYDYQAYMAD